MQGQSSLCTDPHASPGLFCLFLSLSSSLFPKCAKARIFSLSQKLIVLDFIKYKIHKKIKKTLYRNRKITHKKISKNDDQIKSMGKLIDIASSDEVNTYFGSKINKINENDSELNNEIDTEEDESNYIK